MKMFQLFAFAFLMFVCLPLLAQDAGSQPSFLDGIVKFCQTPGGILTAVVMGLEFVLRLVPSAKPLSMLVMFRYLTKSGVVILTFIDGILATLIANGQNTIPQPAPLAQMSHKAKKK